MKIKRSEYRSNEEYSNAVKALKKWKKANSPRKPKRKRPKVRKRTTRKKYSDYLKSDKWKKIREHIHLVRGGKCERCGETDNLQVHHKHYRNIFNEKMKDLELLCKSCHRKEHKLD